MPASPDKGSLISVRNVHKVYNVGEHSVHALAGVSFDIEAGEFVAVVGPSGSGKSTVMNLIGALDVPTSGEVRIAGCNVSTLSDDALAHLRNGTIGFVFQHFYLLPRTTALRQVMLPLSYARPRPQNLDVLARSQLEQVGLAHRIHHYPQQLSGGQQQRVAIARALVTNPRLLLADEPTGALDSKTSADIMQLFQSLNQKGITIVLITHEMDIASYADRRLIFRDGRLLEDVKGRSPAPQLPPLR
jgi:putative ABC transport system ATP-binding protein